MVGSSLPRHTQSVANSSFCNVYRMVMYKRRHYYVSAPSTMPNKRKVITPSSNLYRKRIAYTELKDMNND